MDEGVLDKNKLSKGLDFSKYRQLTEREREVAGEDAVKHFVELDMGVGIVPHWIVAKEIDEGRLVSLPLGKRPLKRRWGMFYTRAHRLRFAESLLVSLCRSVMRDLIPSSPRKTRG